MTTTKAEYASALEIRERMAKADPGNESYQKELAVLRSVAAACCRKGK